jgi:hypothetical protein
MTKMLALALTLAVTFASPALAFEEPDGFRGVKWGVSREELRVHLQRAGDTVKCEPTIGCRSPLMIGPSPVQASYLFTPGVDTFEVAYLSFAPVHYPALRAIFDERYGPPSNVQQNELQNRMGAKYTNETAIWAGPLVTISLSRYGSKLDQGRAWIGLQSALDRENEKTRGAIKKGKDDL